MDIGYSVILRNDVDFSYSIDFLWENLGSLLWNLIKGWLESQMYWEWYAIFHPFAPVNVAARSKNIFQNSM